MLIGRRINERYKIIELIGGGGMANVYLARDIILERYVAVKILRLDYANDPEFIRRFHREAMNATSLVHPNIVNIYDVGEEDNIYYIVMEYVSGETLKQYIQKHSPIPLEKVIDIMLQITSGISHAHQNNIIHRDIKPQNILLDKDGNVKITDFGIAIALTSTTITHTNSVMGSVHYISPEQARGGISTKKSDIYALGIVMFELLTGSLPFSGESAVSIALKHLQTETPSPRQFNPAIPQSVENIVIKATAKDPYYRYDDVEEMIADLKTCLDPERLNEDPVVFPVDDEETKVIPIIQNDPREEENTVETERPTTNSMNPTASPVKRKEETGKKDRKVKKKWPWIIGGISVLIILLGLFIVFVFPTLFGPKDVEVPDVAGMEIEEAIEVLTDAGLEIGEQIPINDDEVPENHVIKTDPKAGKTVKEGAEVNIYISIGKETITLRDYTGRKIDDVLRELKDVGFSTIDIEEVFDESEPGTIISQEPEAGTQIVPDETELVFTVSKGEETFALDDLTNYSLEALNGYASRMGLNINTTEEYNDHVPQGNVIRQDTPPGTQMKKGDTIHVIISKGPEPLPPRPMQIVLKVPFSPEMAEGNTQTVHIYVDDVNHNYNEPYDTLEISEDTMVQIDLLIPPDSSAKYKITIDGTVFVEEVVPYD